MPDTRTLRALPPQLPSCCHPCALCPAMNSGRTRWPYLIKSAWIAAQVTDSYLLALSVARGGQLATFDQRLVTDALIHGAMALHLIR
jgi:uncharacterized protein